VPANAAVTVGLVDAKAERDLAVDGVQVLNIGATVVAVEEVQVAPTGADLGVAAVAAVAALLSRIGAHQ